MTDQQPQIDDPRLDHLIAEYLRRIDRDSVSPNLRSENASAAAAAKGMRAGCQWLYCTSGLVAWAICDFRQSLQDVYA